MISARPKGARSGRAIPFAVIAAILCALALIPTSAAGAGAPVGARAAAWTTPTFVRAIGARGSAGLYAWGLAYNPVSNEIVVGDYRNFQIRRFTTGGTQLGSFYRSAAERRGVPEGLAVDPRDGAVYVSDHSRGERGYVAKFSKTGSFIREFKLTSTYQAWMAMDADGYLYVSDSHVWHDAGNPPQIRKYALNDSTGAVTEMAHWGSYGTGAGQIRQITGLAIDPVSREVFVADTLNKTVNVYSAGGSFLRSFGTGAFKGDLRGLAINAGTRQLYVVDASAGQVERFNADTGTSLGSFGSLGTGPGQFGDGGRQLGIDGSGSVWVADYGNTRVLKFTASGGFIGAYPDPSQNAPAGSMALVRDVAIQPSNRAIYAIEQDNHRLQAFRPDGAPNGMWGRRGSSKPLGFNYPRGLAIQPGAERIWISNTTEHKVRVLKMNKTLSLELGLAPGSGVNQYNEPIDIEFGNGNVYVGDASGRNVKILNATTGQETGRFNVAAAGVAVDPTDGDIFLASVTDGRIYHYTKTGGQGVPAVIGSKGSGPGQFVNPWDIDIVGSTLYVTDATRNVVVAYDRDGSFLGEFGTAGARAGQFNNPSGLTHDAAGKLYIADAGNDRIQVFDTKGIAKSDSQAPRATIGSPNSGATTSAPVTITGTVTDDQRVGVVEVAIQDKTTKLWWDGRISTWTTTRQWTTAGIKGGNVKAAQWWFPLIGAQARAGYYLQVRPLDAAGNLGAVSTSSFNTSG